MRVLLRNKGCGHRFPIVRPI